MKKAMETIALNKINRLTADVLYVVFVAQQIV